MKSKAKTYLMLFLSMLKISSFTFGGGFIIVSLMKKQFVDKYKWLTEKEMLDFTAISQSSPGAIAVNAAILVGFKTGGVFGMLCAVLGTVIPPVAILTAISYIYTKFITLGAVKAVMLGLAAGVAAVIFDVAVSLFLSVWKESRFIAAGIALTSFLLVLLLKVNVIYIIIAAGIIGFLIFSRRREKK